MFLFPSTLSSTITYVSVDAQQLSAVDHSEVSGVADGGHFPLRPPHQRRPHPSSLQLRWAYQVWSTDAQKPLWAFIAPAVRGSIFPWSPSGCRHPPTARRLTASREQKLGSMGPQPWLRKASSVLSVTEQRRGRPRASPH